MSKHNLTFTHVEVQLKLFIEEKERAGESQSHCTSPRLFSFIVPDFNHRRHISVQRRGKLMRRMKYMIMSFICLFRPIMNLNDNATHELKASNAEYGTHLSTLAAYTSIPCSYAAINLKGILRPLSNYVVVTATSRAVWRMFHIRHKLI